MIDKQAAWNLIEPYEGCERNMYVDTEGYVTTGCGNLLRRENVVTMPWQHGTGTPATRAEILAEYERVSRLPKGISAAFYRRSAQLWLPAAFARTLFDRRVDEFTVDLAGIFPGFEADPPPAQLGCLDMIFNLGPGKLVHGFPTFCAAVRARDWKGAAAHCHRLASGDGDHAQHEERQIKVKALFLAA